MPNLRSCFYNLGFLYWVKVLLFNCHVFMRFSANDLCDHESYRLSDEYARLDSIGYCENQTADAVPYEKSGAICKYYHGSLVVKREAETLSAVAALFVHTGWSCFRSSASWKMQKEGMETRGQRMVFKHYKMLRQDD